MVLIVASILIAFGLEAGGKAAAPWMRSGQRCRPCAGTLGDIRDHVLAAELSAWPGLMDEIDEDQVFIIDSYNRLQEVRVRAVVSWRFTRGRCRVCRTNWERWTGGSTPCWSSRWP